MKATTLNNVKNSEYRELENRVLHSGIHALQNIEVTLSKKPEVDLLLVKCTKKESRAANFKDYEKLVIQSLNPHWRGSSWSLQRRVKRVLRSFVQDEKLKKSLFQTPARLTAMACMLVLLGGYPAESAILPSGSVPLNQKASKLTHKVTSQLVVIDTTLPDWQQLLPGLPSHAKIVLLSLGMDLFNEIETSLAKTGTVESLHIFSHGTPGELQVHGGRITEGTLHSRKGQLQTISTHLIGNREIFLYGCNVGEGEIGQRFVSTLGHLTRANIAVSTDPTGSSKKKGDWDLELVVGTVTGKPLSSPDYSSLLVVKVGDGSGGGGGGGFYSGNGGNGGAGGGGADVLEGTDDSDVIFGDGSGGGGGGGGDDTVDIPGTGGAGGGGIDIINGGNGDDILFGDGFDGFDGFNGSGVGSGDGGDGGYGGGGGGGGGYEGSGGKGGIGGGGGGGGFYGDGGDGGHGGGGGGGGYGATAGAGGDLGAMSGSVVLTQAGGGGGGGGSYGGGLGGYGGGTGDLINGSGGTGGGSLGGGRGGNGGPEDEDGGGGGAAFGGESGGNNLASGADGGESETSIADDSFTIYNAVKDEVDNKTNVDLTTLPGGSGNDILDGGPGSDELFGMGGKNIFVFEADDISDDTVDRDEDTVHDWAKGTGNKIKLTSNGNLLSKSQLQTIIASQTETGGNVTIEYTNNSTSYTMEITVNGKPELTLDDFSFREFSWPLFLPAIIAPK